MKEKVNKIFNSNKKAVIYSILAVFILLITIVGITYAWFSTNVSGGPVTITSGTLAVTYEQGTKIEANNLKSATTSQVLDAYNEGNCKYNNEEYNEQICYANNFTIRNTGTLAAVVSSKLTDITNTYSNNLKYQIFETTPDTLTGNAISTNTILSGLPNETVIPAVTNNSKTYTLLIWLDENAENDDQGKEYSATITTNAVQTNQIKATVLSEVSRGTASISNNYPNVGETITLTATPNTGYALRSVSVLKETDNKDVTDEVNYNITDNTFTMPSYSVKVLVVFDGTAGSTILTNGDNALVGVDKTTAMQGEIVTITANSNNSYLLKQVNILKTSDNTDITDIVDYDATNKTFEMPDYSVTIMIEYYILHDITVNTNDVNMGTITSNRESALIGDIVTLTLTPNANYKLNTLTILKTSDLSDITTSVGYNEVNKTFIMPDYPVTVNVNYQVASTLLAVNSNIGNFKRGLYTVTSNCSNADSRFEPNNWEFRISNLTYYNSNCTATFTSDTTNYPTLYNKIISLWNNTNGTNNIYKEDHTINGNPYSEYRYEGEDTSVNNYVWFNNELWRIIGAFPGGTPITVTGGVSSGNGAPSVNNTVKIIRNDDIGSFAWDKDNTNDWTTAELNTNILNNLYLNSSSGTCDFYSTTVPKACSFVTNGLTNVKDDFLETVTWPLGAHSSATYTNTMYEKERGKTVYSGRPYLTTAKVGLMYPSDYGYSVASDSCQTGTNLSSYGNATCGGKAWLLKYGYEWTLTPSLSFAYSVFSLRNGGSVGSFSADSGCGARPVVHLKSNVYVTGGTGKIDNPYKLAIG